MRAEAAMLLALFLPPAAGAQDGRALYTQHCASCHQSGGEGVPFLQPALAGSAFVVGQADRVVEMLLLGSDARAPMTSDYDNIMGAFDYLSDEEVASVASYIRSAWGNEASPVSAADVAALRRAAQP